MPQPAYCKALLPAEARTTVTDTELDVTLSYMPLFAVRV